jgi:hypothetical protein
MLISCLAYSSTLTMKVIHSSETLVDLKWTTWGYILEDRTLHNHRCENLKSSISYYCLARIYSQKFHWSARRHNLLFKCIRNNRVYRLHPVVYARRLSAIIIYHYINVRLKHLKYKRNHNINNAQ